MEKRGQIRARRVDQFEIIPRHDEKRAIFRGKRAQHLIRGSTRIDEESRMDGRGWRGGMEEIKRRRAWSRNMEKGEREGE